MSKKGYYHKYEIRKADGSGMDPNADYFVLRLDKDPHARAAARAYARSCYAENEKLAVDLEARVLYHEIGPEKPAREMNYQEIKSKYPKAWVKAEEHFGPITWIDLVQGAELNFNPHALPKCLFDFFDQQGIIAGIGGCPVEGFSWWIYGGSSKKHPTAHDFGPNPTRQDAESAAFTKAFELLEEKL